MLYRQEQKIHAINHVQTTVSQPETDSHTGITEIVLPNSDNLEMVLPSLAFLSRCNGNDKPQDRWLTWFPPAGISKSMLSSYGFDLSRVRFVYPKNEEHCFWLFWEALAEGNSHTVVGSPGKLTEQQLQRLEHASQVGGCSGLLLRSRTYQ